MIRTLACLFAIATALIANAAEASPFLLGERSKGQDLGYCDGEIRTGWHFYCDPERLAEPEEEKPEEPPAPAAAPAAQHPPQTATERMEAIRAALDEAKHRAILEPTYENLQSYMAAQKIAMTMASTFADQWQRVLYATPSLDANITSPVSSIGGRVWQDLQTAEQEAALHEAATRYGLMFIFEAAETCAVCPLAAEIVGSLRDIYEIRILPVSLDGTTYPDFPTALQDTGQLANLGLSDLPRPSLALVDPKTNAVTVIGAGLLTQDEILQRVYVLTKTAPGERYTPPFADRITGGAAASRQTNRIDALGRSVLGQAIMGGGQ